METPQPKPQASGSSPFSSSEQDSLSTLEDTPTPTKEECESNRTQGRSKPVLKGEIENTNSVEEELAAATEAGEKTAVSSIGGSRSKDDFTSEKSTIMNNHNPGSRKFISTGNEQREHKRARKSWSRNSHRL